MYRQVNGTQFCFMYRKWIYVFTLDVRTKSVYFPTQHWLRGFYYWITDCILRSMTWFFKYKDCCIYLWTDRDLCQLQLTLIGFYNRNETFYWAVRTASLKKAFCCLYRRTNRNLCNLCHKLIGFYKGEEKILLNGTNWVLK